MRMLNKQPSNEIERDYRRMSRQTAHTCWNNYAKAIGTGSESNGELRRFIRRK